MTITLSLMDVLKYLCLIAGIVALVYLAMVFKNLVQTIKLTNRVMEDTTRVSGIVANRTEEVDGLISDFAEGASGFRKSVKDGDGLLGTLTSLIGAITQLAKTLKGRKSAE